MKLPEPNFKGRLSVEEALLNRRSIREYSETCLTISEISQLLWSAYGITSPEGYRTAPSAMALYPLEIDLAAGGVEGLPAGVYRYSPQYHELQKTSEGDLRESICGTTFDQPFVAKAAAVLVFSAVYERTCEKFGEAGRKFVHMDLGHSAENVHLQAVALEIGTVVVGAFRPDEVKKVLSLAADEQPLYLMPLGKLVNR
jgi:SagB-type dehydrogenase family enzyme